MCIYLIKLVTLFADKKLGEFLYTIDCYCPLHYGHMRVEWLQCLVSISEEVGNTANGKPHSTFAHTLTDLNKRLNQSRVCYSFQQKPAVFASTACPPVSLLPKLFTAMLCNHYKLGVVLSMYIVGVLISRFECRPGQAVCASHVLCVSTQPIQHHVS